MALEHCPRSQNGRQSAFTHSCGHGRIALVARAEPWGFTAAAPSQRAGHMVGLSSERGLRPDLAQAFAEPAFTWHPWPLHTRGPSPARTLDALDRSSRHCRPSRRERSDWLIFRPSFAPFQGLCARRPTAQGALQAVRRMAQTDVTQSTGLSAPSSSTLPPMKGQTGFSVTELMVVWRSSHPAGHRGALVSLRHQLVRMSAEVNGLLGDLQYARSEGH